MPFIDSFFNLYICTKKAFFARNPWVAFRILIQGGSGAIILPNGEHTITDFDSYNKLRIIFQNGFEARQFKLKYKGNTLWLAQKGTVNLVAPLHCLPVIEENFEEQYQIFDYNGMKVLDVGGFIGETAVFFKTWGAKEVVVYEPAEEHYFLSRLNMMLNKVPGRVEQAGVSGHSGKIEVCYNDLLSSDFGLNGPNKAMIEVKSIDEILSEGFDIAKFDCEGCEKSLLHANKTLVKSIPNYVIECHSKSILFDLIQFFRGLDYKVSIVPVFGETFDVIVLKAIKRQKNF